MLWPTNDRGSAASSDANFETSHLPPSSGSKATAATANRIAQIWRPSRYFSYYNNSHSLEYFEIIGIQAIALYVVKHYVDITPYVDAFLASEFPEMCKSPCRMFFQVKISLKSCTVFFNGMINKFFSKIKKNFEV